MVTLFKSDEERKHFKNCNFSFLLISYNMERTEYCVLKILKFYTKTDDNGICVLEITAQKTLN
jgi:hypothetical protein